MASERKQAANRRNAQRSTGPRDTTRTRLNARTHGILAREALILAGEGREDAEAFDHLSAGLRQSVAPGGMVEELLVDQLAALAWRLRRVYRYEAAAIRMGADRPEDVLREAALRRERPSPDADAEEDEPRWRSTEALEFAVQRWRRAAAALARPDPLSNPEAVWRPVLLFCERHPAFPDEMLAGLRVNWETDPPSRAQLEESVESVRDRIGASAEEFWDVLRSDTRDDLAEAEGTLESRRLALDRQRLHASLPDEQTLERAQRYEGHLSRHFYKALHELQRLQAARMGARPLAPLALDIDVSGGRDDEGA